MDFFEGTEKLLELWFTKANSKCTIKNDLRNIPREELEKMLDLVNCKILSTTQTRDLDSYVLSESSLFVAKHRVILKTCGTTRLLNALPKIIELATIYAGFDAIEDIFYSRKRFAKPELQVFPHTSFEDEIEYLQEYFPDGSAYALGRLNSECWYLFTLDKHKSIGEPDQTLEIIMTKLDPEIMKIFTREVSSCAEEASEKSGIDKIFPNALLDAYLFEPCGYSVNAILPDGYYFTIHITPEPTCSYVSFETNAPVANYPELINRILKLFKPGQFIFTLFANEGSSARDFAHKKFLNIPDFKTNTYQLTAVKNYDVIYAQYTKRPI